jgi:hypothetical protein
MDFLETLNLVAFKGDLLFASNRQTIISENARLFPCERPHISLISTVRSAESKNKNISNRGE